MNYSNIIRSICDVFNNNSVEYMIVGGTAVALHGYYRKSTNPSGEVIDKPDLDFWYNPTYSNYFNLLNALEELGKDVTAYREEQTPNPRKSVFRLEFADYTLDILPGIKAPLRFWPAFVRRQVFSSSGVEISFISLDDLLQDKAVDPRPKDIEDIDNLKKNNPFESGK